MPVQKVVAPQNLGADFRAVGTKIVNDSILGAAGAPTGAPPEVDKVWHWIDTSTNRLTHYWNAATAAWVAYAIPPALVLTDNARGTVTIDPGSSPQEAIRPIQELTEIGADVTVFDFFTALDTSAGADAHRSLFGERLDRFVNAPLVEASPPTSPGGIIPATVVVNGRNVPIDSYVDFNGSHIANVTLPVPVYLGQTFLFRHLATFDTTIATTNTTLTSPLTLTQAQGGAEFVAIPNAVAPTLRWALRTERPITTVKKFVATQPLAAGVNTITHNLGLTAPLQAIVEVRNAATGASLSIQVIPGSYGPNELKIRVSAPVPSAQIIIVG